MDYLLKKYRVLEKKGEGTFSEVLKCQRLHDNTLWACKKMRHQYSSSEQVNGLREVQALKKLNPHPNILQLEDIVFDKKTGSLFLICELMDMNAYEMIKGRKHYIAEEKIRNYMYQLVKSIDHLHRNGIFHRDIKPENILIKNDLLKLADFGSCRSIYSKQPYTEYISTRWYRSPECLLTNGYYSFKMDIWGVGCVFFEIMSLHPLFPGANELDQINKIHDVLGTPEASLLNKFKNRNRHINFDFPKKVGCGIEKYLPHASKSCIDLIYKLCVYDADERISAKHALKHVYFKSLREKEQNETTEAHEDQENIQPSPASTGASKPKAGLLVSSNNVAESEKEVKQGGEDEQREEHKVVASSEEAEAKETKETKHANRLLHGAKKRQVADGLPDLVKQVALEPNSDAEANTTAVAAAHIPNHPEPPHHNAVADQPNRTDAILHAPPNDHPSDVQNTQIQFDPYRDKQKKRHRHRTGAQPNKTISLSLMANSSVANKEDNFWKRQQDIYAKFWTKQFLQAANAEEQPTQQQNKKRKAAVKTKQEVLLPKLTNLDPVALLAPSISGPLFADTKFFDSMQKAYSLRYPAVQSYSHDFGSTVVDKDKVKVNNSNKNLLAGLDKLPIVPQPHK